MKTRRKKISVILLDGDTIQTVHVAHALRAAGCRVTVVCESRLSFGYLSRYPNKRVLGPPLGDCKEDFRRFLTTYLRNEAHDVLIPMYNDSAEWCSRHREALAELVCLRIPELSVFARGYDKELTMEACRRAGIPHPRTMNPETAGFEETARYVGFPALIKPNVASGARGITRVSSLADLQERFPVVRATHGPATVQEFVPQTGEQLKVQMIRFDDGSCSPACVLKKFRYFPVTGGSSCCNITVVNDAVKDASAALLSEIGWVGFADFDFIQDPRDGVFKVMEINPRVPACIGSAIVSGLDFPNAMVRHAMGETAITMGPYQSGKILRFLSLEFMWFLFSQDRFRARPNWFHFWGRDVHYQDGSWRDPLPMFAGFFIGIRKYMNPKFWKAKFGGHQRKGPKNG